MSAEAVGSNLVAVNQCSYEAPTLVPDMTIGLVIVGMSQAGKTTLLEIVSDGLAQIDPDAQKPLAFPLSNGFRGVTMHMLERAGIDVWESGRLDPSRRDDL